MEIPRIDNATCQQKIMEHPIPNDGNLYCPGTFDEWLCWLPTKANTVAYQKCPEFIQGFYNENMAHKECLDDGTWFVHPVSNKTWSNYTNCPNTKDDRASVVAIYVAGYSISLIALILSLFILLYFKSLRCARITVHINLFFSFAINNLLWILTYTTVTNDSNVLSENGIGCRILHVLVHYALLTNYTWMLCEGLYLHTVLVSAFVSETKLLRTLYVIGWGAPLVPMSIYVILRSGTKFDSLCWVDEEAPPQIALIILSSITIVLNLIFLCNIVRVLCTKLRAAPHAAIRVPRPSATALQAFRATFLLVPLLGLQYLLTPFRPERYSSWEMYYEYVLAISASFQGLCVATLFCFCNGEVLAQIRRRWRALTFRPRANSCTATTVSFVRSTAAPPHYEEKV